MVRYRLRAFKIKNTTNKKHFNYNYMNTLQAVYDKLGKIELAKHEVELASIQVLQEGLKKVPIAIKQLTDAYKLANQVNDSIDNAMDAVKSIGK